MKTLRDASRELAEKQKSIGEKIEGMAREPQGNETDPDGQKARGELAQAIQEQSEKVSEIVEQMRTLSEASEVSEPLLSDALYETVRNTTMNGIEDSLEEVRNLTYFNRGPQAATAEKVAARGIEELKESIEKAAEKVLGNEADALRLARSELDRLIEESKSETERLSGTEGEKPSTKEGQSADQTGSRPGREPGEKGEKGEPSATPGTGTEKGKGEIAGKGDTPGKGEGKEKGQGESPESLAGGGHDGEPGGTPKGSPKGTPKGSPKGSSPAGGNQRGGLSNGGDDRGGRLPTAQNLANQPLFFDQSTEQREQGPITGEDYESWSDRLGAIEEMLPQEDLRNSVAQVRDDARAMRIDFRRDNLPPAAATVGKKITDPLIELRQRVSEELAKSNRENPVSPIDRDPVPSEFRDLVRRYYEELGAGN